MTRFHFLLFSVLTVFGWFHSTAQSNQLNLEPLVEEIKGLIGDSWYVDTTENGLEITYCRSCGERYSEYLRTDDHFQVYLEQSDFFTEDLLDSVCYFPTVSVLPFLDFKSEQRRIAYLSNYFRANDILKFNIRFEEKWSQHKYDSILKNNNLLKDMILEKPLYKTSMDIFSDYRFCIPRGDYLMERTAEVDFYFERLPYSSLTLNASIFIEHNKSGFFSKPMLVDKSDEAYFDNSENMLEDERRRILKIVALVLGIHDYYIVN